VLSWRCPVYRWRELVAGAGMEQRTCRPDTDSAVHIGLFSHPAGERETPSGRNRKGQSTDAGHRGGPARSSDEGPVMGLEPRGRQTKVDWRPTLLGGADGEAKRK